MTTGPGKRPRDSNQLAKFIADRTIDRNSDPVPGSTKNPAAVALGRLGGVKGGKARAANLSPARRSAIAKKAARARWGKKQV